MIASEWCEMGLIAISTVSTIVIAFCAVVATTIAKRSLYAWRCELHGKTEYDLAWRVLREAHAVREAVRVFRNVSNPFRHGSDLADLETWRELLSSPSSRFAEAVAEAEVMWPSELTEAKKAMYHCLNKVPRAIRGYNREILKNANNQDEAKCAEYEQVLWDDETERGEFGQELDDALAKFETFLRPLIKT